jgi:pimeloyl-ACP methyl ester carboxylesterase
MHSHHASARPSTRAIPLALLLVLALVLAACSSSDDGGDDADGASGATDDSTPELATIEADEDRRPVVFVHGSSGSGAQFESQALRFASNGYPIEHLRSLDYDSPNVETDGVPEALDALIAEVQEETGHEQVDLIGHSLGTFVSGSYLESDPERAANVAHYVNVDGRPWPAPPGGVDTLALWGESGFASFDEGQTGTIDGAENVQFEDQSHVEVATSPESFEQMYAFFNDGEQPETTEILPEEQPTLAGKAVHFPQNEGVPGTSSLEVYEVDPESGERLEDEPVEVMGFEADGSWGPFEAEQGASYEMVIVSEDPEARQHHFYLQPVDRSDHLIRLNTSPPEGGIGALLEQHPDTTALTVSRYREWWGDQGEQSDELVVDGQQVLSEATSPRDNNKIGVFLYDVGGDGESTLDEPIATLYGIGFLTGVDVAMPADAERSIAVTAVPRGVEEDAVTVNVPAWPSTEHAVSVHFRE